MGWPRYFILMTRPFWPFGDQGQCCPHLHLGTSIDKPVEITSASRQQVERRLGGLESGYGIALVNASPISYDPLDDSDHIVVDSLPRSGNDGVSLSSSFARTKKSLEIRGLEVIVGGRRAVVLAAMHGHSAFV